jgi:hypothetical protein
MTCPGKPSTPSFGWRLQIKEKKHCGRPGLKPELAQAIRDALAVPGRPGIRVIAKQFGVSPMTVQNVAN